MDGPSTRGGKRGRKKVNMRPTDTGGQIYMSKDYAKKFLDTYAGDTDLQKLMEKKITERRRSGKMTPEESGDMKADLFLDQVDEAIRQKYEKPRKMNKGGAVKGYMGGGKVKKMESGGKTKKTADGIAIKGKTRPAMKGYGKVG